MIINFFWVSLCVDDKKLIMICTWIIKSTKCCFERFSFSLLLICWPTGTLGSKEYYLNSILLAVYAMHYVQLFLFVFFLRNSEISINSHRTALLSQLSIYRAHPFTIQYPLCIRKSAVKGIVFFIIKYIMHSS